MCPDMQTCFYLLPVCVEVKGFRGDWYVVSVMETKLFDAVKNTSLLWES